ncbi:MAG TPA: lytic transglycosylase domain-containing protein [Egibacteraceae bacterium]|nr:lytic transglycosylase domain-containing protein [Egibacteraceae bacterium]
MRLSPAVVSALAVLLAACAPAIGDTVPRDTPAMPVPGKRAVEAAEPAAPSDGVPPAPAEGKPVAPEDAAELARLLTAAESALRDPARTPESLADAGHWQQVAYRKLVQRPELVEPVIAALPAELRAAARGNVLAGERLAAMHSPAKPAQPAETPAAPPTPGPLPKWRILTPPPADQLKAHYQEAEAATGVHWTYLAAVNLVETRMGRIRGDSVVGAQGPMQFMPPTWAEWGEGDVHDPRDAIMAAGRYLRWGGMPGDVDGAIFRYNRDVRYVDAVRAYAEQMQADPRAYYGYYHWQVYYATGGDSVWLREGYDATSG